MLSISSIRFHSVLILLLSYLFCLGQDNPPIPINYSVIEEVLGDLDKDGIDEFVVAYNTEKEIKDENILRELIIYKKDKDDCWLVWYKSKQALYGSQEGGMMGDPYGEIKIDKGVLSISQYGGSSWKWGYTDKYRFQNGNFELIGYTSSYGKVCNDWTVVDYNLSTGKLIVKKEYESCENSEQEIIKTENEIFYRRNIKVTIDKRSEKEIKIISPKYKHEIYLAIEREIE